MVSSQIIYQTDAIGDKVDFKVTLGPTRSKKVKF